MDTSIFPTALDSFTDVTDGDATKEQVNVLYDAIEHVEAKTGINGSTTPSTLDYLIKSSSSTNPGHKHPFSKITDITATASEINAVCNGADFNYSDINAAKGNSPWFIPLSVLDSSANASSYSVYSGPPGIEFVRGSGIDAYIEWSVALSAGTWSVVMIGDTSTDLGITSIQIDDVEKGTADWYASPYVLDVVKSVTGIAVSSSGKYTFKIKTTSKNASSSGYTVWLRSISLVRTA